MIVAVTGASGYIGGWLLAELGSRGHEVHAQDVRVPAGFPPGLQAFVLRNTGFQAFDLRDNVARARWLGQVRPDAVIHLAALYGRVWGETDPVKTAGVNAGLTAALARDCRVAGARLLYVSSSEVYGTAASRGDVSPDSPLEPLNMYGMSKKWGEEAARRYCPEGLMVARLNMPYGPAFRPPAAGERPATSGRPGTVGYNVLHSMVWEAELGLDLVVHRGTERCLTWAGDTVRGVALVLESGEEGTWNVNRNDDHRTVLELARRVVDITGSTSRIVERDVPEGITLRKSLSNAGLLSLGWAPSVELDEGIKRTWEYYRKFDRHGVWQG